MCVVVWTSAYLSLYRLSVWPQTLLSSWSVYSGWVRPAHRIYKMWVHNKKDFGGGLERRRGIGLGQKGDWLKEQSSLKPREMKRVLSTSDLDFGRLSVHAPCWHHFYALRWLIWAVPGRSGAGSAPFASHLPNSSTLTRRASTAHVSRWGLGALGGERLGLN